MSTAYSDLLRRHDDPIRWDHPASFDYALAIERFRRFVAEFVMLWDKPVRLETDGDIQDASFHSQIFVPVCDSKFVVVRFSNFGDMATFAEDVTMPDELRHTLQSLFEKHGYAYLPAHVLSEPYSGNNPGVTGIRDWWIRYFDYV